MVHISARDGRAATQSRAGDDSATHVIPLSPRSVSLVMKRTGLSLAAVTAALLAAAGCSAGPAAITAHGAVTVDYTSTAGGGPGDDLNGGDQVVIVNSAGTVVGNGTLTLKNSGPGLLGVGEEDVFSFTVTVPGGLPRYGIQVNGTRHGTLWDSAAQMKSGPGVEIDETTGL